MTCFQFHFFKFFSVTKRADEYSKANVNGCKLRVTAGGRTEIAPTSSHQFANNIQNSMGKTYYLQSKLNHNSQLWTRMDDTRTRTRPMRGQNAIKIMQTLYGLRSKNDKSGFLHTMRKHWTTITTQATIHNYGAKINLPINSTQTLLSSKMATDATQPPKLRAFYSGAFTSILTPAFLLVKYIKSNRQSVREKQTETPPSAEY